MPASINGDKQNWEAQVAADAAESTLALNPVVGVNLEDLASAARMTLLDSVANLADSTCRNYTRLSRFPVIGC